MFWNLVVGLLSFGLNLILTPKPQNAKPASLEDFDIPVAEEGLEIPVIFGTEVLRAPNVVWYGDLRARAIKGARRYGLFGPRQVIGHNYFLGMHLALCMGPVDMLKEIRVDDEIAWDDGTTGGEITIEVKFEDDEVEGDVDVEMGYPDQLQNAYLLEQLGSLLPAFRGVCCLVVKGAKIGKSTFVRPWDAKLQRIFIRPDGTDQWYPEKAAISRSGNLFRRKIELPGSHKTSSGTSNPLTILSDMGNDKVARISSSGTSLEIFDALTGELLNSESISYTPSHLMVSKLTDEVIIWTVEGNLRIHDLSTGNLKQEIETPPVYGGGSYKKYVGPGHVGRTSKGTFLMYGSFLNIVCYEMGDDWQLLFNEFRGFLFGGFGDHVFFNELRVYQTHGDGHISIWLWDPDSIGSKLGTRSMAPKWSYDPPLGLGSGQILPTSIILTYLEDHDKILLVVGAEEGHAYVLTNDMQTQLDHLALPGDPSGVGILAVYQASNSAVTGTNRFIFYSTGNENQRSFYELTIDPLAMIERYMPAEWGDTGGDWPSTAIGVGADHYMLMTEGYLSGNKDTLLYLDSGDKDMNPAHIIREGITHVLQYLDSDIDDDVFTYAADLLYDEGFGLTLKWSREEEIGEFISVVLSHIDAYLYTSRVTGKFVLKLVRDDYDIDTIPVIDEDDVVEWIEVSRRGLADAVNSVTVKYTNRDDETDPDNPGRSKDASHQVDNIAQMQQMAVGGVPTRIMATRHYPGISTGALAVRVAERDLKSLGIGMISGKIRCKRTVESLNPGDPFRLVSARHRLDGEVMRVAQIELGDGRSNHILISFIQDVFSLNEEGLVDTTPSDWENPANPPQIAEPRLVWEAPLNRFVDFVGSTQAVSLLSVDPDVGIVEAAGSRATNDVIHQILSSQISGGSGYEDSDIFEPAPGGTLVYSIDEIDTSIVLVDSHDLDVIVVGTLGVIDGNDRDLMEIVRVEEVNGSELTISRGVSDTIPKAHDAGADFILYQDFTETDGSTYTDGDEVLVKMRPSTPFGTLDIDSAPINSVTFDSRSFRPFRPADCKLSGQAFGTFDAEFVDPIVATWSNRNRLTDINVQLDWTDASEPLETDQTVEIRLLDNDLNEIFNYSGLTGTSQDISQAYFGDHATAWVEFNTRRNGYTAWQAHRMYVLLPFYLETSGDMQAASPVDYIELSGDMGPGYERLSGSLG